MLVDELRRRLGRESTAAEYIEAQERERWQHDHPDPVTATPATYPSRRAIDAVAEMLVALARAPESEQLDVLADVVKTWLERDSRWASEGRRRLWAAARGG